MNNYHFKTGTKATRDERNRLTGKEQILVEEKEVPVNITLFHPHIHQLHILNEIENGSEKFYTLVCSRRFGKSSLAKNLCIKWALSKPNEFIGYLISGLRLARTFYDEILNSFPPELFQICIKNTNKSDLIIEFVNGSKIQFFSFDNSDKLRGHTLTKACCDESELINDEDWYSAIYPIMANSLCDKVLLLGTPLDCSGFYFKYYERGLSDDEKDKRYKSFHYDIDSIPSFLMSDEDKKDQAENTPQHIYNMEWKAIFSSSNISVFGNYLKAVVDFEVIEYDPAYSYYGGLDVAKSGDYLVYTVMRSDGQLVYLLRINKLKYHSMAHAILNIVLKYNVRVSYIEVNAMGDAMLEILQSEEKKFNIKNHKWHAIYTNNITKQDYVEALIIAFQQGDIKILNIKELKSELGRFVPKITDKARVRTYSALSGHDDCVISLCLSHLAYKENKKYSNREFFKVIKRP